MESFYLTLCGGAVAAALLAEGFAGRVHVALGAIGIAVAVGVLVVLPKVWRGGWIDFSAEALEVHSAWGPTRRVPYGDIEVVEVFAGRRTARFGRRVQFVPSIVKLGGRRVLLNDFRGMATPLAGAEVSRNLLRLWIEFATRLRAPVSKADVVQTHRTLRQLLCPLLSSSLAIWRRLGPETGSATRQGGGPLTAPCRSVGDRTPAPDRLLVALVAPHRQEREG